LHYFRAGWKAAEFLGAKAPLKLVSVIKALVITLFIKKFRNINILLNKEDLLDTCEGLLRDLFGAF
jgi:hypothetical protein